MIPLGAEDAAEVAAAVAAIAAAAPEPAMPRCVALFAALRTRLAEGRGFALLRGLAADGTPGGAGALFALLSRHLGAGAAPPPLPLGADMTGGFVSGGGLRALLALDGAGAVTLVSAGALHNAMLLGDRALLAELYDPIPLLEEDDALAAAAVFALSETGFAGRFAPDRIEAAAAAPHNAPITGRQRAAVSMLAGLAGDAAHALALEMRPGDLLCLDAGRVWMRQLGPAGDAPPAFLLDPL